MPAKKSDYRLKITDPSGNYATYLTRTESRVSYFNGSETPLALSNLILDNAAETRFALADALDGNAAAKVMRDVLAKQWARNLPMMPKVTVL